MRSSFTNPMNSREGDAHHYKLKSDELKEYIEEDELVKQEFSKWILKKMQANKDNKEVFAAYNNVNNWFIKIFKRAKEVKPHLT